MRPALFTPVLLLASLLAAGCDQLGIESASAIAARREADGKAIGGACRHAGRAIEDCYVLNRRADRAAIYAGWREMNEYMVENKLQAVVPQIQAETQVAATRIEPGTEAEEKPAAKPGGEKAEEKPADKSAATEPRKRRAPP
ncbi:hypothetical protein [Pseudaquabacterium terrae]|uniref:hypothetical protein n=1 Tax=Pseudaquabacterium terrae TaxID=2732868 RepID=UPI001FE3214B|nr:hypothetical protein [Aquabacterium terrae]